MVVLYSSVFTRCNALPKFISKLGYEKTLTLLIFCHDSRHTT